jgi:hypothetical protein
METMVYKDKEVRAVRTPGWDRAEFRSFNLSLTGLSRCIRSVFEVNNRSLVVAGLIGLGLILI